MPIRVSRVPTASACVGASDDGRQRTGALPDSFALTLSRGKSTGLGVAHLAALPGDGLSGGAACWLAATAVRAAAARAASASPRWRREVATREEGISRLTLILGNMSEATRLEQLLQRCEKQPMLLDQWLVACVEQSRQISPAVDFRLQRASEALLIEGSAEHLVQLLDKVVANAVEFSTPGQPICLRADSENGDAVLSVSNQGPSLDPGMQDRIFDSMVSARPQGQQTQPHLGLGLHIARLITDFHGGSIYAENLLEEPGVIVVVRLPLRRPT